MQSVVFAREALLTKERVEVEGIGSRFIPLMFLTFLSNKTVAFSSLESNIPATSTQVGRVFVILTWYFVITKEIYFVCH